MKMRKITSLTALLSFILMVLTSIILYIVPQGRIAYWADWRLWGLTKSDWGNIHINLGFLFLLSISLHIYYNWKPIVSYLKNKTKEIKIFTPDFNVALIVTVLFTLATYFLLPPFSWVITLSESIKDSAATKYGEPPYGHAELSSLKTFTKKINLNLEKSMELLQKAEIKVENEMETIADIGRKNDMAPQQIYLAMASAATHSVKTVADKTILPDSPPTGAGNLTLADFCTQYNLNVKIVIRYLKKQGVTAKEGQTIKKISAENRLSTIDIYEKIKEGTKNS